VKTHILEESKALYKPESNSFVNKKRIIKEKEKVIAPQARREEVKKTVSGAHSLVPNPKILKDIETKRYARRSTIAPSRRETSVAPRESMAGQAWSKDEHQRFLNAIRAYKKDWKKITEAVGTRTRSAISSHAQFYKKKMMKLEQKSDVLLILIGPKKKQSK
jgi:SHAQKYF class myb-like DNA-binding protein